MSNRKVLVTGGAGFIGSHIVDLLIKKEYEVSILDNFSSGCLKNVNPSALIYCRDLNENLEDIFEKEKPEIIIHHASQINVRKSIENPSYDARQNIMGSLNLFEYCKKYPVKKVIFASSGGTVYGNPESIPVREDAKLRPMSPYGIAKATIEEYLRFYRNTQAFDSIILRYANVYGPRQSSEGEAGVISVFLDKKAKNQELCIWGDGKQTRDFVYVQDVAIANLRAIEYTGNNRIFNIGTGLETSINDIAKIISEKVTHKLDYKEDIPQICLDNILAQLYLKWKPLICLREGIGKTAEARGIKL
jgi:UDP-glucose 4-epimerase